MTTLQALVEWEQVSTISKGAQVAHRVYVNGAPDALVELVLSSSGIKVLVNEKCERDYGVITLSSGRSKYESFKRQMTDNLVNQIKAQARTERRSQQAHAEAEKRLRAEQRQAEREQRRAQKAVEEALRASRPARVRRMAAGMQTEPVQLKI